MIWAALVLASVGAGWLLGRGDASANLETASSSAPVHLLLVLLGATLGLYGRDRVRLRRAYASPSLAYAGKFLFFAGLAPAATWSLAPVDWPAALLPALAAGCAAGVATWIANLPPRL